MRKVTFYVHKQYDPTKNVHYIGRGGSMETKLWQHWKFQGCCGFIILMNLERQETKQLTTKVERKMCWIFTHTRQTESQNGQPPLKSNYFYNCFIHTVFQALQVVLLKSLKCLVFQYRVGVKCVFPIGWKSMGTSRPESPEFQTFRYVSEVRPHVLTRFFHVFTFKN